MAGLCKVIVIGNVGTDPEMRYTPQGVPMTIFRLAATTRSTGPDGQRQDETEWFSVICWRNLAEQVNQYLSKGRRAYVEGRLRSRTWVGPDGTVRFRNEILADRVLFLDRPPVEEAVTGLETETAPTQENEVEADDLPF